MDTERNLILNDLAYFIRAGSPWSATLMVEEQRDWAWVEVDRGDGEIWQVCAYKKETERLPNAPCS